MHKWKCETCECFNEYTIDNCKACDNISKCAKWICGICTFENSYNNHHCGACEEENFNVKKKIIDVRQTNIRKTEVNDQWKCQLCEMCYMYNIIVCSGCSATRIENGLWQCGQCTLVNNCKNVMCEGCNSTNDNLTVKYCGYCKKNKVKRNEIRCVECVKNKDKEWQCLFTHCGEWNKRMDKYCQKCKIYRYSSPDRGMRVTVCGSEKYMWVCYKCYKYNEDDNNVCMCGENRL